MWVSWVGTPPEAGTDHHSEGMLWADATCTPSSQSNHPGTKDWAGAGALNRIVRSSGKRTGASMTVGTIGPLIFTCFGLLPLAAAMNNWLVPSLGF